ncbi:MAG: NrfD/PsrC family molybdoenzyme membrane anchor subunit [Caldilineaceae bacterium]
MQNTAELGRRTAAVGTGSSPYATQVITKMPNWGILTAFDILLNNLAVGTFLAVILGWLLAPDRFAPLVSPAIVVSLLLLGADLLLLVVDLGDTWRFHHMLRVFKPRAPMSLGTWSLTLFGILLGVAALVAVLRWLGAPSWLGWIGNTAATLAVIPALGAILYKGVLFSVTSQPGWRDARWFGSYISNSAILLGCSLLLALAAVLGATGAAANLRAALLGLLLLDILLFVPLYRAIAPTFKQRYGENGRLFFWLGVAALGWIIPFLLLLQGEIVEMLPAVFFLLAAVVVRIWFVLLPRGAHPGE